MAGAKTELTNIRLNKFLAANTSLSRRKADDAVFSQRVKVNGSTVSSPAIQVDTEFDEIKLDGKIVKLKNKVYLAFYKPKAVLTSYERDDNKKCLSDFDLLNRKNLSYSGRLDYNSEGLIIFSNDGDFIQRIQKPKHKIAKEYIVFTDNNLSNEDINILENGITYDDISYMACEIKHLNDKKYKIILYEGKNRQVRNMMDYCGKKVRKLIRIKIGCIGLNDLAPGEFRKITKNEIKEILNV